MPNIFEVGKVFVVIQRFCTELWLWDFQDFNGLRRATPSIEDRMIYFV